MSMIIINKICRFGNCTEESIRRCPECGWDFCKNHISEAFNVFTIIGQPGNHLFEQEIPSGEWMCFNCDCGQEED